MKQQLNWISAFGAVLFLILACSNPKNIEGNWEALDNQNEYSEVYFEEGNMRIFTDIAGFIPNQKYTINEDSLVTNILSYHIKWINLDSVILSSNTTTFYLKRIKSGVKLSDYTDEQEEDVYRNDFYNRMKKRKEM